MWCAHGRRVSALADQRFHLGKAMGASPGRDGRMGQRRLGSSSPRYSGGHQLLRYGFRLFGQESHGARMDRLRDLSRSWGTYCGGCGTACAGTLATEQCRVLRAAHRSCRVCRRSAWPFRLVVLSRPPGDHGQESAAVVSPVKCQTARGAPPIDLESALLYSSKKIQPCRVGRRKLGLTGLSLQPNGQEHRTV